MSSADSWCRWERNDLYLTIRVVPRARHTGFDEIRNSALQVRLNAPPVEGKANRELLDYLGKQFGVARNRVELIRGERGREKQIVIRQPRRIPSALRWTNLKPSQR